MVYDKLATNKKLISYIGKDRLVNNMNSIIKNRIDGCEINLFISDVLEKLEDIIYDLERISYLKNKIRALIIIKCLIAIKEKAYFDKHIKSIKRYDCEDIRKKFNEIKPFLIGDNISIHLPINPNLYYLELFKELENILNFYKRFHKKEIQKNESTVENILNTIFDKKRKAKPPIIDIERKQEMYDTFKNIVLNPQCDREVTEKEKEKQLKKLQKIFPNYIKY